MKKFKVILILEFILLFKISLYATTHYEITNNTSIDNDRLYRTYSQIGEGGVFYITQQGILNLGSSINFSTNSATQYGGAICNNGTLNTGTFVYYFNNTAQNAGALLNYPTGVMNVGYNNVFENNHATGNQGSGGAIANAGSLTISSGTKFISNTAGWDGGAISNNNMGGATLITTENNVLFSSNTAGSYGGAIRNNGSGTLYIGNNNIFQYNGTLSKESYGGAIHNNGYAAIARVEIGDGTNFYSNYADYGGAICNEYEKGNIDIGSNVVFSSNKAHWGGSIYNSGTLNVGYNNCFEQNEADAASAILNVGGTLNISSGTKFIENKSKEGAGSIGNVILDDNYATTNIDENVLFSSNSAKYGAAIQNNSGEINIGNNDIFKYNIAENVGGAIYQNGYFSTSNPIVTIGDNVKFISNYAGVKGGAIFNEHAWQSGNVTLNIGENVIFDSNVAEDYGGAICNEAILTIGKNTQFSYNRSIGTEDEGGEGGAICNSGGIITIGSYSTFMENSGQYGGAVYNQDNGEINISSNVKFVNNSAIYGGGAIYSYNGNFIFDDAISFSSNTARHGGAIDNRAGKITFLNGAVFNNNKANVLDSNESATVGGAIFNLMQGKINLIADTNNVEFTGNTADGVSNAIYDYGGTINLWASNNADIIFNDGIKSHDNTSILNINQSSGTLPTTGKIILNENMSGYTGTVNLYGGEIELQAKTEGGSTLNTNKFFSGDINLSNGTLNVLNNSIDNITINNLITTSDVNLKFDTDLSNNTSDNFTVTNSANGQINLTAINILGVNGTSGQITLFNNSKSPNLNILTNASYGGYEYNFTNGALGKLNYIKGEQVNLKRIINKTIPEIRSYSLAKDEIVTENLGQLGGTQLTIFGNGYDVDGNGKSGIKVSNGQILNIDKGIGDKFVWKNFNKNDDSDGVIYNRGRLDIGSNVNFTSNTAMFGGAINSEDSILNIGNDANFSYNKVIGTEEKSAQGGAISTNRDVVTIGNNVLFYRNEAELGSAGAIDSGSDITIGENAQFIENRAKYSGAIYNDGNLIIGKNVLFSANFSEDYGGAIDNKTGTITFRDGVKFLNNSTDGTGGAINNSNILNLIANTNNVEFTGNTTNGISNAIHDSGGTINLWASENADIIFNDRITSEDEASVLNINQSSGTLPTSGKIILNEDMSGYTGKINLYSGTIELGEKGTLFGGDVFVDNATIDMTNNILQQYNFNDLTINNNLSLMVDVDLANKQMDTLSAESFDGAGKINVKAINILTDAKDGKAEVIFTNSMILKNKIISVDTASSKLFKYKVAYNDGKFNFKDTNEKPEANPVVLESVIAGTTGGLITQTTVLNQVFSSIDNIRNKIIQAKQKGLLYASTADMVFDNNNRIESGLWIRPYMSQDSISFDSLDVDNTLTGTLAGIDLSTGENSLVSFYLGYAGSNQKYEDIKINQTGYILGATGMFVKDNWYAGLTANINFNKAESESDYGTDSFDMNMFSVGAKAGYNYIINDRWTLEPNLTLMYGNVSNQEYETTQGAKIDSQSNSNIVVEPQVKTKFDLTNGWQPYGLLGYVTNISDKGKVIAEGIGFEIGKIDGYMEFGAGVEKEFINTPWSCYAQVTGRSGGINGFSGNIGVKYSFLNKTEKEAIRLIKDINNEEKEARARLAAEENRIEKEEAAKQKALKEERLKKEKEEQAKKKALEEEHKKIEKEARARLAAEENRIEKEEAAKQKALKEERLRKEKEEQERKRQLEIERKIQENYN